MARTEKGSRIKGLPPRIQLQQRDAATGSYPTNIRCSSDNRTGMNNISFNDLNTPVFGLYDNMLYPSMVPSGSRYVSSEEMVTNFSGSGRLRKGIGDEFYCGHSDIVSGTFAPQGLTPFRDNDNPACDGKTNLSGTNTLFYATGSAVLEVGEGFSSPLWSKQKIEIPVIMQNTSDITLWTSFGNPPDPPNSNIMCYFNWDLGIWQGISNLETLGYPKTLNNYIPTYCIPTTPCSFISASSLGAVLQLCSAGNIISTFGFPFDARYHATSSQTTGLKNYINGPFLLEKAVLTISATYSQSNVYGEPNLVSASINTVFLLNQRSNMNYSCSFKVLNAEYYGGNSIMLSSASPRGNITTVRDIIGWNKILSCASGAYDMTVNSPELQVATSRSQNYVTSLQALGKHDVLLKNDIDSSSAGVNWSQQLELEIKSKTPVQQTEYYGACQIFPGNSEPIGSNYFGGRNGLGTILTSGRSLLSEYVSSTPLGFKAILNHTEEGDILVSAPNSDGRINPYILMPDDKLILAWALPLSQNIPYVTLIPPEWAKVCSISFPTGCYKLTLYGSYLREGKEYNDTLNQLLCSDAIHEVIGD